MLFSLIYNISLFKGAYFTRDSCPLWLSISHCICDLISEAGVIILPPPHELDEAEPQQNGDVMDTDPSVLKWPSKPGFTKS